MPELIFGHLLTSDNYARWVRCFKWFAEDDNEKKVTGGRNGHPFRKPDLAVRDVRRI